MRRLVAGAIAVGALVAPSAALAQAPPAPPAFKVRIGAHSYPRPFGLTYVYGYVRRPDGVPPEYVSGRPVALEQSSWPYTQWTLVGTGQTTWLGYFSFRFPQVLTNTMYRATVQFDQPLVSQNLLLHRPYRVALSLRARKGKRSALVTARGSVRPGNPGVHGWLQQLSKSGRWRNFKRVTLQGAGSVSRFRSRPFRIKRNTTFRVLMPTSPQNTLAVSGERSVHLR